MNTHTVYNLNQQKYYASGRNLGRCTQLEVLFPLPSSIISDQKYFLFLWMWPRVRYTIVHLCTIPHACSLESLKWLLFCTLIMFAATMNKKIKAFLDATTARIASFMFVCQKVALYRTTILPFILSQVYFFINNVPTLLEYHYYPALIRGCGLPFKFLTQLLPRETTLGNMKWCPQ